MSDYIIFHNPNCSKSRKALEFLNERNLNPTIRNYLNEGLNQSDVEYLLDRLESNCSSIIRTKEEEFINLPFNTNDTEEVKKGLVRHPKLLQRPIVVTSNIATICRSPEKLSTLIDKKNFK